MSWNNYPIIRLLIPLLVGILLGYIFPELRNQIFYLLVFFGFFMVGMAYIPAFYPSYRWRYLSTGIIYLMFLGFGILLIQFHYPYQNHKYVGKHLDKAELIYARVAEVPEESAKTYKILVDVEFVEKKEDTALHAVIGKAMLYLAKGDSSTRIPDYGDHLVLKSSLEEISPPGNPKAFDYKAFMKRKGVQYSAYVKQDDYLIVPGHDAFSLKHTALKVRNKLLEQLKNNGLAEEEYAIAASLLLGYREALNDDLLTAYRSAGVMHILCVSGMHVGILYLILSQLLSFLKRIPKGLQIRMLIIILNIWGFAIITGLSPSVSRAAIMFTFVAVGKNLGRNINIYNTLAASAMFTLILSPHSLFDVGFQLSYTAVISIAALFQPIYQLYISRFKIPDYLWQIVALSLAAQIGTAPLSMYYFHQFPNYFLLSNIVVMLLVTPVFYLALATLLFSFIPVLSSGLAFLTTWGIKIMNYLVFSIQAFPYSVSTHISYSTAFLVSLILFLIFLSYWLTSKKQTLVWVNLILVILLLGINMWEENQKANTRRLLAFQSRGSMALLIQQGKEAVLFCDSSSFNQPERISYPTSSYLSAYALEPERINMDSTQFYTGLALCQDDFLAFGNQLIAMHTPERKYRKKISCDVLFIRKVNSFSMVNFMEKYSPKQIVLSAELWDNQRDKIKAQLAESTVPVWDIQEQGAYLLDYN